MDKGLVSIIVPVYNVENYLNGCINSIINQTYKNLEIILIDDESPDNCPKMCDDWSKKDNRIIVVHKKNGGVSNARNKGIEIAKGEFIAFVDSDDYIELDYIERFMNEVDNETNVVRYMENKYKREILVNSKEFIDIFNNTGDFNSACKQVIRKNIIKENNIKFAEKIRFAEDTLFSISVLINAKKVKSIIYNGYKCYENAKSTTRIINKNVKMKNIYELSIAYTQIYELFEKKFSDYNTNKYFCETNRYILEMNEKCNIKYKEFNKLMKEIYINLNEIIFNKFDTSVKYNRFQNIYIKLLLKKHILLYYILIKIRKKLKGKKIKK